MYTVSWRMFSFFLFSLSLLQSLKDYFMRLFFNLKRFKVNTVSHLVIIRYFNFNSSMVSEINGPNPSFLIWVNFRLQCIPRDHLFFFCFDNTQGPPFVYNKNKNKKIVLSKVLSPNHTFCLFVCLLVLVRHLRLIQWPFSFLKTSAAKRVSLVVFI